MLTRTGGMMKRSWVIGIVIGVIIGVVLVQGILFLRRRVISGIERAEARLEERER